MKRNTNTSEGLRACGAINIPLPQAFGSLERLLQVLHIVRPSVPPTELRSHLESSSLHSTCKTILPSPKYETRDITDIRSLQPAMCRFTRTTCGRCDTLIKVERTITCGDSDQHAPADDGSNITEATDTCASYSIPTPESL